jgi:hypothetical protein
MATEKQTAANRLNAQKSTGPRTPEGRAAVRLNGVTHGLTAETLVLKGESESDFKALFESLEAEHEPTTPTEETLVAQLAMATWRLRRLYNTEAGFYNVGLIELTKYESTRNLDFSTRLGKVADCNNNTLALIGRQEARLERTYYRALNELQRLRKEREAKLALVCGSDAELVQAKPSRETNHIQPPPEPITTKIASQPQQVATAPSQPVPPEFVQKYAATHVDTAAD